MSYSGALTLWDTVTPTPPTPVLEQLNMIWETSSKERQGALFVVPGKGASILPRLTPGRS